MIRQPPTQSFRVIRVIRGPPTQSFRVIRVIRGPSTQSFRVVRVIRGRRHVFRQVRGRCYSRFSMLSGSAAVVTRVSRILGRVRVPGDKSISHRYAMLAAMADGTTHVDGYSHRRRLRRHSACLGRSASRSSRDAASTGLAIRGRGLGLRGPPCAAASRSTPPTRERRCGCCGHSRRASVPYRHRRRRVAVPPSHAPRHRAAHAHGRPNRGRRRAAAAHDRRRGICSGITYPAGRAERTGQERGAAGRPARSRPNRVVEPSPTRDHTERALAAFGVRVDRAGLSVSLEGGQRLAPPMLVMPGDISSAVFWLVLAAGRPGSTLEIDGVGLNPTRTAVLDVLRSAGAEIETDVGAAWALSPGSRSDDRARARKRAARPSRSTPTRCRA